VFVWVVGEGGWVGGGGGGGGGSGLSFTTSHAAASGTR